MEEQEERGIKKKKETNKPSFSFSSFFISLADRSIHPTLPSCVPSSLALFSFPSLLSFFFLSSYLSFLQSWLLLATHSFPLSIFFVLPFFSYLFFFFDSVQVYFSKYTSFFLSLPSLPHFLASYVTFLSITVFPFNNLLFLS